tara:strand:- start:339 stop:539 length:201 start_codon:yes stop_codon:yes gene_type:complete
MNINQKVSQLRITIEEIKNISAKPNNHNTYKTKIEELHNEISRLKKGISESVDELEEFLGEENAKP